MSVALLVLSYILGGIGAIWIVVLAWQRGVLWGVGCFLFPFIQLIYVVLHWKEAKNPFFFQLAGFATLILSHVIGK